MSRDLTADEAAAVRSLQRLAKRWPKTLKLFSWSGALVIFDIEAEPGNHNVLANIIGIPNDGGDP